MAATQVDVSRQTQDESRGTQSDVSRQTQVDSLRHTQVGIS